VKVYGPGVTRTVDDILGRLRNAGGRLTEPRRAVIEALLAVDDHPTADDLAAQVATTHPSVHKSTVYRTLDALAELGLVEHVHLGHGSAVYHLTGDDALHLMCDGCGAVTHVTSAVLDPSRTEIEQLSGFVLQPGHFALPGLCADCATDREDRARP
jgi:Fe2+ or Zn2+ uptake regulation protein